MDENKSEGEDIGRYMRLFKSDSSEDHHNSCAADKNSEDDEDLSVGVLGSISDKWDGEADNCDGEGFEAGDRMRIFDVPYIVRATGSEVIKMQDPVRPQYPEEETKLIL
jgi:hypothetical protein